MGQERRLCDERGGSAGLTSGVGRRAAAQLCSLIEEHTLPQKKLIEKVKIPHIAREDDPAALRRVEIEACVVQQCRASARIGAGEPRRQPGQHSSFARGGRRRSRETMAGHIFDHMPDFPQDAFSAGMGGIEAAEQVRQLGQADGRVIHDPGLEQVIHRFRRAPLQHVDVDAGVE